MELSVDVEQISQDEHAGTFARALATQSARHALERYNFIAVMQAKVDEVRRRRTEMLLSLTPCKMRRLQDRLEALKSIRSQREVRAPFVVRMPVRQIRHALTHHASFPFRLIHQAWRLLANQWSPELTASLVSHQ